MLTKGPSMYVCLCHGITDRDVKAAIDEGKADSVVAVHRFYCGQVDQCGACDDIIENILSEADAPVR